MTKNEKPLSKDYRQKVRQRLLRYLFANKGMFSLGIFLEFAGMLMDLIGPILVADILNHQIVAHVGIKDFPLFYRSILYYCLILLATTVLMYVRRMTLIVVANRISRMIQVDVFRHLQTMPISYFDYLPAGQVVSRVTNDAQAVQSLFSSAIPRIITVIFYTAGTLIMLLRLDYRLVLLAFIPIPIILWAINDFRNKSGKFAAKSRQAVSGINGQLNETIQGIEVVQSLQAENYQGQKLEKANQDFFDSSQNFSKLYAYSAYNITENMKSVVLALILAYFGIGQITAAYAVPIGSLYIFIEYMTKLFREANTCMQNLSSIERSKAAAAHIFELLQEKGEEHQAAPLPEIKGSIRFAEVSFAYKEDPVLKNVSFAANPGETIAFVGHTGSGKSTIMNLLLHFYQPQEGKIYIDDRELPNWPIYSLREQMAIVLQEPFLFTGTLYSNIALGKDISLEQAKQALIEVGAQAMLDRLPEGLMTPVQEKGSGFSAGERQLISFARALAQNPKILILDEATANVDSETESLIQKGIQRLEQGRTTLIIAHRLSTIRNAQQIFVLDKGRISEHGSHRSLMEQEGIYAKMYREQSKTAGQTGEKL